MILEVQNGCFGYPKQPVILENINLRLEEGHILATLGPNGIGKTTLLKCMIGLLPWHSGKTLFYRKDIHTLKPKDVWSTISYIPQSRGFAFSYTGLDFHNQIFVLNMVERLAHESGISAIMNTHYPTNAMSVADEFLMLNRKGEFFYGPAAEILNEENISYSFDVQVLVDELHYQGRSVRSIVPVALREETAV